MALWNQPPASNNDEKSATTAVGAAQSTAIPVARDGVARSHRETVLGLGVTLEGKIEGDGDVRIAGKITGEIRINGDLIVDRGAHLTAKVSAANVTLGGELEGNIAATGQLEAARVLGLSEGRVLALVRGPQAFRFALAPMTNDFVALLKDSSLVSVLTVLELTKQTQIFATNIGSWVVPGLLCAGLYLIMSLPLAALARRLEQRWKMATV